MPSLTKFGTQSDRYLLKLYSMTKYSVAYYDWLKLMSGEEMFADAYFESST